MKKLVLLAATLLSGIAMQAQPWMPPHDGNPVKLKDAIARYNLLKSKERSNEEETREGGKVRKEGKDYLFDRWVYYWERHLDAEGNMIGPIKNWQEWELYKQKVATQKTKQAKNSYRTTAAANWQFAGPDSSTSGYSGIGRVNVTAFHPTDPNTFFVGTAGGGAWKTTDAGNTWTSLYSNLPTLGVSDIVVNPRNPNTIYICTGDADAYDNYSMGVIKSMDGGVTWNPTGITWTRTSYIWARSLIMNPRDTNTLILASRVGIHITHDGGATWVNVRSGDFKQVLYKPNDTSIVYASKYGDTSAQVMRSTNGGVTWTQVTNFSQAQRICLAVTPANPSIVKALASKEGTSGLLGVYNSTNSGASFTPLFLNDDTSCNRNLLGYDLGLPTSHCNGQGWYDLCMAISPTDANKVCVGGINTYYSDNGGSSWEIVNTWWGGLSGVQTVHADKHHLAYNPLDNNLYEGNDGGVYRTNNPATGFWYDLSQGLGITQFYRAVIDNGVSFCIAGAQDNGTKMLDAGIYSDLTGGDGMQCRIDYDNPTNVWYTSSQYGRINRTTDGGFTYGNISDAIPDTNDGNWITPYIVHPTVSNILLAGIRRVYMSTDMGSTWGPISPVFNTSRNVNHIAMSPRNGNCIYIVVSDNTIHFSPDLGGTWSEISHPYSYTISRIVVDPMDSNRIWVTLSGYGGTKVGEYNRTTGTWANRTGSLPDIPVQCITIDSFSGTKYIGNDVAIYYMDTTMSDWALYNTNLPSVEVTDLSINYTTNEIWAATYGRGMWHSVKREMPNGVSVIPYAADIINVYPNPGKGVFTVTTSNKLLTGQPVTVHLISASGAVVHSEKISFDAGGNLKVTTRGLPSGTYVCEVSNEKMSGRCRVVILQ